MFVQHTIRYPVKAEGIGLHTGQPASITLRPAPPDTGIVMRRDGVSLQASYNNVSETLLSTNLARDGVEIRTVEHLLAATYGLGIHNLYVDVRGPELPIMDGSASEFVQCLLKAEPVSQEKPQPYIRILEPVVYSEGQSSMMAVPASGFHISCRVNYNHPAIRFEKLDFAFTRDAFIEELAGARTFGFLKDVPALQARGLARGGSMENAIVLGDTGVLNEGGLRFRDEFVRHKALDLIGDMALWGFPIEGHILANESGHRLHVAFLRHLVTQPSLWEVACDDCPVNDAAVAA